MTRANRPLAGIVVLDFGQVYQGPYATLLMAKAGADVIKIEPPQGGPLRRRAPPRKAGPAVVDFLSGIHLYAATVTALFERERTGVGRLVEVAMEEAAYATLTSPLQAYFETGLVPPRTGNSSHGRSPLGVYPTK